MNWRAIGQNVIGSAHLRGNTDCQDALAFQIIDHDITPEPERDPTQSLICCISDGAGSATHAAEAASFATQHAMKSFAAHLKANLPIDEAALLMILEEIYSGLSDRAAAHNCEINEFSCTFLGCVLQEAHSLFFQIGDGAIIRDDGNGVFAPVWWPHNGEYSNTTTFLIDDPAFSNLKIKLLDEPVNEVGLFSDGLQHLVLNTETLSVHQPFFEDLFKWLRRTRTDHEVGILQDKLAQYLGGEAINNRTDDDKTLFLATRITRPW